jgi:hypothetical protein
VTAAYHTQTDDILRVQVTAGDGVIQVTGSGYNNYQGGYGCIQYDVYVNGQVQHTPTLRYGDGSAIVTQCNVYGYCWQSYMNCCPTAPQAAVLDFSHWVSDHGGGPITVKVVGVRYPRVQGCTLQTIYETHQVTGSMHIQTNQTDGF